MTMPELWGWVEVFLRQTGAWEYMVGALGIMIIVSLALWFLNMLRS